MFWWWCVIWAVACGGRLALSSPSSPPSSPYLSPRGSVVVDDAFEVLRANWDEQMNATLPEPGLYPHQWSWDSCFIAIGNAYSPNATIQRRAMQELTSLFSAQWRNGFVAHIRFNPLYPDSKHYFPGANWWQSWKSPEAPPKTVANTSGIIDPPIHSTAVLRVYRVLTRSGGAVASEARAWLREIYPRLALWHRFLAKQRAVLAPASSSPASTASQSTGLIYIRHPWASGMDNSPLWDLPLQRMGPIVVPPFNRTDCKDVNCTERPSMWYYDHYVWLLVQGRDAEWRESALRKSCPFQIADVLLNSIWAQANDDLAALALELGLSSDASTFHGMGARARDGMRAYMWKADDASFYDLDVSGGSLRQMTTAPRTISNVLALWGGGATVAQARAMRWWILSDYCPVFRNTTAGPGLRCAPSLTPYSSHFDRKRYWRGPLWINTNWFLANAIKDHYSSVAELTPIAARARQALQLAVERHPTAFSEYFDPFTLAPLGSTRFSWTAALFIDSKLG